MRQSASEVKFAPAPQQMGPVWGWIAVHPSGQSEEIQGFHCPLEARKWRSSNGFRAWLRTRGYLIEDEN
jgi:hypothetical protein